MVRHSFLFVIRFVGLVHLDGMDYFIFQQNTLSLVRLIISSFLTLIIDEQISRKIGIVRILLLSF